MKRFLPILVVLAVVGGIAAVLWSRTSGVPVTTVSEEAYELYRQAEEAVWQVSHERAIRLFEQALAIDPEFAMAARGLSQALSIQAGTTDRRRELLELAYNRRDQVSQLEALLIERSYAGFSEDHETAEKVYQELVQRFPNQTEVREARARRAWGEGHLQEATELFESVLKADPSRVHVHNVLGYLYQAQGDHEQAEASLKRYVYFCPDYGNPHDSLGEIYMAAGLYTEAIKEFLTALDLQPELQFAWRHLSIALATTGQFQRAYSILDHAEPVYERLNRLESLELDRAFVDMLASNYSDARRRAMEVLENTKDQDRRDREDYRMTACILQTYAELELGELDLGKSTYGALCNTWEENRKEMPKRMQGLVENQLSPLFRSLEVRMAALQGDLESARKAAESIIVARPYDNTTLEFTHAFMGWAFFDASAYEEAERYARRALEFNPRYPFGNLILGITLAKMDRPNDAADALTLYLEIMQDADDGHVGVTRARRVLDEIQQRS